MPVDELKKAIRQAEPPQRVTAIVVRSSTDEFTYAQAKCRQTDKIQHGNQMLTYISRAVTDWVKETEEGKMAYAESCEDYNVGDLSIDYQRAELQARLERHGVLDLDIEVHCHTASPSRDWTYDTLLVDGTRLEEDDV